MRGDNVERTIDRITAGIERFAGKAEGVIIGLSGGIDSAVVLHLAVRAVGSKRVNALVMPSDITDAGDVEDAVSVAEELGVHCEVIDITDIRNEFLSHISVAAGKRERVFVGNLMSRIRMCILYSHANAKNLLVLGTTNRSELMIGYFTKYGDGAADFEPIGNVYKTEVKRIAGFLGIPDRILNKPPSAGLWRGQTDESEIGMSYEKLDGILSELERRDDATAIAEKLGIKREEIEYVKRLIELSEHKRSMPKIENI